MKNRNEKNVKKTMAQIARKFKNRRGQSLVEYSLVLALIAVVSIMVLRGIGKSVNNKLLSVNSNLQ